MPHEAAVEATFVNKDPLSTLKLGQARGIAMLVPAQAGLPVAEYAPNAVKKSVIGVGHGAKEQIQMMVKVLLPKADFKGAMMLPMRWPLPFATRTIAVRGNWRGGWRRGECS